jgi:hypothetical protein
MKKLILMTLLFSRLAFANSSGLFAPFEIGGDISQDACPSVGVVTNNTYFIVEKNGRAIINNIDKGQEVFICTGKTIQDFQVLGIIFSDKAGVVCDVTSAKAEKQSYKGPCKLGWIDKSNIMFIAD